MRREEAADLVTLATAPSVADFTAPNSLSVSVFPPNTKAKTARIIIRVKGIARTGDANQTRTSSIAAIPRTA